LNSTSSNIVAIILSAGQSNRMQGIDKTLHEIHKQPVILFSIKKFLSVKTINKIVIVSNNNNINEIKDIVTNQIESNLIKKIDVIDGGLRRQDSVKNAIMHTPEAKKYLIHDAARPFVSKKLIVNVLKNLEKYDAVVPIIKISDSLKKIQGKNIIKNLNRDKYALAQTPQGYKSTIIEQAFKNNNKKEYSDCASMVLDTGINIYTINGEITNKKITTRKDLE